MSTVRTALIVEVRWPGSGSWHCCATSWEPGPWLIDRDALPPEHQPSFKEASLRATYFATRAAYRLHGRWDSSGEPTVKTRWWRKVSEPFDDSKLAASGTPHTAELLALGAVTGDEASGPYLLVLHVDLTGDPLVALERLVSVRPEGLPQPAGPLRGWVKKTLGLEIPVTTMRVFSVTFSALGRSSAAPPTGLWTEAERYLFGLASATTPERYPLHPESHEELLSSRIKLSSDWEALVLRDGVAFAGRNEDTASPYLEQAHRYVQSIYLDAMLLGLAQRSCLTRLADELANLGVPTADPKALEKIENRHTAFRNEFWWQHVTQHGHATDLLVAFRDQHRLTTLFDQVTAEIQDYSVQVQTRLASQTNAFLGFIAIVGLPFSVLVPLLDVLGASTTVIVAVMVVAVLAIAGTLSQSVVGKRLVEAMINRG